MADIIKLVPTEDQDADEVLDDAKGQFETVMVIGWGADGIEYRTNAPSYGDMAFLLMLCQRLVADEIMGE